MSERPTTQARCSCGAPSEWRWDPYDEELYETYCFRCTELAAMKGELWALIMRPLDTNQIDKFVEIVTSDTVFLPPGEVTVKRFKG